MGYLRLSEMNGHFTRYPDLSTPDTATCHVDVLVIVVTVICNSVLGARALR